MKTEDYGWQFILVSGNEKGFLRKPFPCPVYIKDFSNGQSTIFLDLHGKLIFIIRLNVSGCSTLRSLSIRYFAGSERLYYNMGKIKPNKNLLPDIKRWSADICVRQATIKNIPATSKSRLEEVRQRVLAW